MISGLVTRMSDTVNAETGESPSIMADLLKRIAEEHIQKEQSKSRSASPKGSAPASGDEGDTEKGI